MKLNRFRYVDFALFLCAFVGSLTLNYATQKSSMPNTDSNQTDLFSDLLIRNQSLRYYNELNDKYGIPIFGIRGLLGFGDRYYVPSVVPGIVIIRAVFNFTGLPTFLINPIFVFLGLFFFNRIVRIHIFHDRFWPFLATAVYFFSGAFTYASSLPLKDLVATSTFFGGLYYFLNGIREERKTDFMLFGFLAGVTMWMCYPNLIFFLPAILLYVTEVKSEILKRNNLGNLVASLFTFLLLFFPLYFFQVSLFGGFLNLNNPVLRLNHYEAFNVQNNSSISSFILDIDGAKLLENFCNQFLLVNPVVISLSIVGFLCIIWDAVKKRKVNKVLLALSFLVALQFLFYLGKDWSGVFFKGSVGTSYSRYLLISWGVLITLSVYAVKSFVLGKPILVLLCIYLVLSGLTTGLYTEMAVEYWIHVSESAHQLRNDIVENTPEDSVIFTSFYDKYIYPARQTAIYVAIPKEERVKKTIWLMKELLEDGYSVYIVDERDEYAISPVRNRDVFTENGLETERAFGIFYKIMISNNPNGTEKT